MKEKIVIIGGGGHAKDVISLINKIQLYVIVGYTDICDKGKILSIPYLGTDTEFFYNNKEVHFAALGVGEYLDIASKESILNLYINNRIKFPNLVSPKAIINEEVSIGEGTVILDNVVINPNTKIGRFVTIYPNCVIEHDSLIEDNVYLAPAVNMCGGVKIGECSKIGNGVSIKDLVQIKPYSKIEPGSTVLSDN